jgi:hypothetical protein
MMRERVMKQTAETGSPSFIQITPGIQNEYRKEIQTQHKHWVRIISFLRTRLKTYDIM